MPKKILPESEMRRWLRQGKSNAEIVRLLDEQHNIRVTRQAVSVWKKRAGLEMDGRYRQPRALPWRVKPEHRQLEPARAIRIQARLDRGQKVDPTELARLERAKEHLRRIAAEQGWQTGAVFHYEEDTPQGWFVVPRRPEGDGVLTRTPQHMLS